MRIYICEVCKEEFSHAAGGTLPKSCKDCRPVFSRQGTKKWWAKLSSEQRKAYWKLGNKRWYEKMVPLVYLFAASDGTVDYVGRGTEERVRQHKSLKDWWTPNHITLSMTCDNEWQAMEYEGKWGGRYLPRYNKEGYRHSKQKFSDSV